jgi:hypothetical protein
MTGWLVRRCLAVITALLLGSSAQALCVYHGKLYAKTTIHQEFADSRWVVRAKVVAAETHWSEDEASWTIYNLRVLTSFKGRPPAHVNLFTYRDSGGFYLDKGMANDLGGEYLLSRSSQPQ